jgi:hypothetical protein
MAQTETEKKKRKKNIRRRCAVVPTVNWPGGGVGRFNFASAVLTASREPKQLPGYLRPLNVGPD